MLLSTVGLIIGFVVLIISADYFVKGASSLARNIGISPLIIGLTIIGLGTSAPEMLVAGMASWNGNTGLAVGNAIGSNIANIGLVLGMSAIVAPIFIQSSLLRREFPLLLLFSSVSFLLLIDGQLSSLDGMLLLTGLFLFLAWLIKTAHQSRQLKIDPLDSEFNAEIPIDIKTSQAAFFCISGLIGLILSSKLLVWAAINIATYFGVSDLIIGLTIVALGTSLPELAASITSILKKEPDLALGNIIGSNIFNLLAVLCLPGLIHPGPITADVVSRDMPFMLFITFLLFFLSFGFGKEANIGRGKGVILVFLFTAYLGKLYIDTTGFSFNILS